MKTQKRKMYTYLWRMKIKKIILKKKKIIEKTIFFFFFLCVSTINNQQMSLLHTKQFNVPLPALTFMVKRVTYAYWNPDDVAQVCCLDRDKIIAAYEILSIALNLLKCGVKCFYFMFLYLVFGFFLHSFCILCSFKLTVPLRNFLQVISGCLQMTILRENHWGFQEGKLH